MQQHFEDLIGTYIENKVGVADNFLNIELASFLKQHMMDLFADRQFHAAGTGNREIILHNEQIRSDQIYWLDKNHNNPHENEFFRLIDQFVLYLNESCYTGINGYEFHYTLYEAGDHYTTHIDQFRNDGSRAFSMIMYLNADWVKEDGGELCIHHDEHSQLISPQHGKCVFFKSSELAHEVLTTFKPRWSITGWLKTG